MAFFFTVDRSARFFYEGCESNVSHWSLSLSSWWNWQAQKDMWNTMTNNLLRSLCSAALILCTEIHHSRSFMKLWIKVQIKDVIPVISFTGYRTWPCPKDARKSHQGQRAPSSFCPNKQACLRTVPWCTGTSRAYHTGIAEFMSSRRAVRRNIHDFNAILWYMYTSPGVFYTPLRMTSSGWVSRNTYAYTMC